jgi:NitT/TauT family transport system permease protein
VNASYVAPSIATGVLVCLWELSGRVWSIPKWLLPTPSNVLAAAWKSKADLLVHTSVTLSETLQGFGAALLIGIPLALCVVTFPTLWRALSPLLAGLQAIPKNAIAPLLILWFGTGVFSKVAITFLICFFPIVVNMASGLTLVDRETVNLMRSMKASKWQEFLHVRFPNSLPYLFAACKVSITLAIVGAVIGEFVAADAGLGYLILVSSSQLQTDVAFVAISILAICGMALYGLVAYLEAVLVPWARDQAAGGSGEQPA